MYISHTGSRRCKTTYQLFSEAQEGISDPYVNRQNDRQIDMTENITFLQIRWMNSTRF